MLYKTKTKRIWSKRSCIFFVNGFNYVSQIKKIYHLWWFVFNGFYSNTSLCFNEVSIIVTHKYICQKRSQLFFYIGIDREINYQKLIIIYTNNIFAVYEYTKSTYSIVQFQLLDSNWIYGHFRKHGPVNHLCLIILNVRKYFSLKEDFISVAKYNYNPILLFGKRNNTTANRLEIILIMSRLSVSLLSDFCHN